MAERKRAERERAAREAEAAAESKKFKREQAVFDAAREAERIAEREKYEREAIGPTAETTA